MLDYPFFGILALSLQLIPSSRAGTLATNGKHILYNPVFIASLPPKERLFVYLHEIGHVILMHMFRRGDRNHRLWNVACDYAVNDLLSECIGPVMPSSALYDLKYHGMSAEEIYAGLVDQIEQNSQAETDANEDADSENDEDSITGGFDSGDSTEDKEVDDSEDSSSDSPEEKSEFPKEIEDLIEQAEKHGQVQDAPEDLEQHEVEAVVTSAAAVNQLSGDLGVAKGTALDREIERITSKKVPWQAILQRFITETCQADYSWMKPNLKYRQISKGFILPSLHTEKEINIAVVFDTSGSIDQQKCSRFFAEFLNMLEEIEFKELHALSCSHEVFNPQVFHKGEDIEYTPEGWGGTAAAPVWEYFEEQDIIPSCVVYFTDLEIFDFGANPGYPVIWIVDKGGYYDEYFEQNLPFGEIVFMD